MDLEAQALREFQGLAKYTMPTLMKWAIAGALGIGASIGLVVGLITGWLAARDALFNKEIKR